MISLVMIMLEKLTCGILKRTLTEEDELLQSFFFDTPHEPFDVRRQIGRSGRKPDRLDACTLKDLLKSFAEFRVPVHNHISFLKQESVKGISEVSGYLLHPHFVWICGATCKVDAPCREFHHKEQVERDHQSDFSPLRLAATHVKRGTWSSVQLFDHTRSTQPLSQGKVNNAIANLVVRCASRDQFQVFDNVSDAGPQLVRIDDTGEVAMVLLPY